MNKNTPNFFIIGAPKSGTTALSYYLSQHPNIFICTPKEPHYFATDFPKHRVVGTLDEYLKLFSKANKKHLAIGEASATYLFSSHALKRIKEFDPAAKIIVMLRNPIELVYSLHQQFLYDFDEDVASFEQAWNLQKARARGEMIPASCRQPDLLQYREFGLLGKQTERLLKLFPADQVKVIIFDQFISDTKEVYEDVLRFLGVPTDDRQDFPKINEAKRHRFRILGKFIRNPPYPLTWLVRKIKRYTGLDIAKSFRLIGKVNIVKSPREKLDKQFTKQLVREFNDDILLLSSLVNKDLSHWCPADYSANHK